MTNSIPPRQIAYILFDGITLLDFTGLYDPLCRLQAMGYLPDFSWDICALQPAVYDSFGLAIQAQKVRQDLSGYDVIAVPGGFGTRNLQVDKEFLDWLSTASPDALKVSVCTGSLLLGAAGFLKGKKATTHFDEYQQLAHYGCSVIKERIVEDDGVITAGAVASSIDLGLWLCEKWAGQEARREIARRMDYFGFNPWSP